MPKSVLDFDKRGSNKKKQYLPQQSAQRIEQVAHALTIKTGFSDTPGVTLSFDNGTRTFTITPTEGTFEYWIEGIKFTKSSAETVVITDTEGLWYIYYIGTVLTASQTPWDNRDIDKVFVAMIHWDATNNVAIIIGYEVHSHHMSPATHNYLHETIGTNYESGLALVEGTGGNDGKVAMDSGEIHDEDIKISITDGTGSGLFEQELGNTSVFAPAQIPVYYRSGASAWRKYIAGDYPFYDNVGGDNVHYNSYSDPNWASTAASTSAKYIAMWIFGTNNQNEPVIALMGQIESDTLNAAKEDNTLQGLSFGTLPFTEMKILYRLIFKSDSTYAHTEDMRQVDNVPGGTYVPAPSEVSDEVYGTTWEAVTTLAPSKKAVYNKIELVVAGGAQFAFKTITGITNDVVADLAADTLTYTSANGILTIIGNAGTDTITFTVIEGQISLANLLEKNHASLANVTANQHINNLTDIPTRNHNDLQNIDAGDINHLTDVQVNALHAVLTNLTQLGTREHVALQNKNAEENVKHLTDAQLGALHTIYSLEVHDNDEHDPDYEPANANIQSHVATPPTSAHHVKTVKYTAGEAVQAVEDAGLVLSADKSIDINGNPDDQDYTGTVMLIDTTGCAIGDAVYIDGSNSVAKARANAIGTMPCIGIMVSAGKVLTYGIIRKDAEYIHILGDSPLYIDVDTAGKITNTKPVGVGNIAQVIGHSINIREIFVNPSLDYEVVVAGDGGASGSSIVSNLNITYLGGATEESGYYKCNAVGEIIAVTFRANSIIDATEDLIITFTHRGLQTDATITMKKYVGANKTDGNEDFTFNIHNGIAWNLNSANVNNFYISTFTILAATYDSGDLITVWLELNEASREVRFHEASVEYILA